MPYYVEFIIISLLFSSARIQHVPVPYIPMRYLGLCLVVRRTSSFQYLIIDVNSCSSLDVIEFEPCVTLLLVSLAVAVPEVVFELREDMMDENSCLCVNLMLVICAHIYYQFMRNWCPYSNTLLYFWVSVCDYSGWGITVNSRGCSVTPLTLRF